MVTGETLVHVDSYVVTGETLVHVDSYVVQEFLLSLYLVQELLFN